MDTDDPEDRIAELERRLAEQKRIAELERQLAEAKAARQAQEGWQAPPFPDAQAAAGWGGEDRARQYAESLWEGLRSGGPVGPGGPSAPEMAQHREAFMRAAAQAGLSEEQIDNIFKHGKATFKVGHSVVYSGSGAPPNYSAPGFSAGTGPAPGLAEQVVSRRRAAGGRRRPSGTRSWGDRIAAIVGALGLCIGAAAALTATMPASALWMSPFVCDDEYQLAHNVSFQCVGATGSYDVNSMTIATFQTLGCALVLGVAVTVGSMIWRSFRKSG
jgi:uncharacterized membrane protein YgdD (TMEM256/DUF423 family)